MSAEKTRQDALPIEDDASGMERVQRAYDAVTDAREGCTEPHTDLLIRRAERGLGTVLDRSDELNQEDREVLYEVHTLLGTIAGEGTTTLDATKHAERARVALQGLGDPTGEVSGGGIR